MLNGIILDSNSGLTLGQVTVTIFSSKNEKVLETFSCPKGTFSIDINCEEDIFKIIAFKEGYHFAYNLLENTTTIHSGELEILLRKRN